MHLFYMGSKISTIEDEVSVIASNQDLPKMRQAEKHKAQGSLLSCCTDSFPSVDDTTPEYQVHRVKRSRKSLNLPFVDKDRENGDESIIEMDSESVSSTKTRCSVKTEKESFLAAFFKLFDDDTIQDFLWMDNCHLLSDNYLLAMVYVYFRRARLTKREYTRTQFFVALFLAHDMEEDNEDIKLEIYPWALGDKWRELFQGFISQRDVLLQRMSYRAVVSKVTCDEVMDLCPSHPIWKRERKPSHGGALRMYLEEQDDYYSPLGKRSGQMFCTICGRLESPSYTSGYFSVCSNDTLSLPLQLSSTDLKKDISSAHDLSMFSVGTDCSEELLLASAE